MRCETRSSSIGFRSTGVGSGCSEARFAEDPGSPHQQVKLELLSKRENNSDGDCLSCLLVQISLMLSYLRLAYRGSHLAVRSRP